MSEISARARRRALSAGSCDRKGLTARAGAAGRGGAAGVPAETDGSGAGAHGAGAGGVAAVGGVTPAGDAAGGMNGRDGAAGRAGGASGADGALAGLAGAATGRAGVGGAGGIVGATTAGAATAGIETGGGSAGLGGSVRGEETVRGGWHARRGRRSRDSGRDDRRLVSNGEHRAAHVAAGPHPRLRHLGRIDPVDGRAIGTGHVHRVLTAVPGMRSPAAPHHWRPADDRRRRPSPASVLA